MLYLSKYLLLFYKTINSNFFLLYSSRILYIFFYIKAYFIFNMGTITIKDHSNYNFLYRISVVIFVLNRISSYIKAKSCQKLYFSKSITFYKIQIAGIFSL